jgi:pimeloyl-ACP methyl ester carboxylesterase
MRYLTPLVILAAALLAGCGDRQPYVTGERLDRGLVVVLTGIEGRSKLNNDIARGLDAGGVDWAIEVRDWTSSLGPLYTLKAASRNRAEARKLADRIIRYQWSHPGRPVVLVGQSGGAAIAAWTAEAMPYDQRIDGIVMIAGALSPAYQLDAALGNSRRGIANFYSARDWVLLGAGTTITGTMDGAHTSASGRVGFEQPTDPPRPRLYSKLFQVAWNPQMSQTGHIGLHLSSGAEQFVARYVAPLVVSEQWNSEVVSRVIDGTWQRQANWPTAGPAWTSRQPDERTPEPEAKPPAEPQPAMPPSRPDLARP